MIRLNHSLQLVALATFTLTLSACPGGDSGGTKAEAEAEAGKADDGKADEGKADDGKADEGKADDGKADDGNADEGDPAAADNCVSRSVRDSAMLFALGQDRAPTAAFAPLPFVAGPGTKRLRIGLDLHNYYGELPDADVARAIEETAQLCRDLGHTVIETRSPVDAEFELRFNQIFGFRMLDLARAATARAGRPPAQSGLLDTFVMQWADLAATFTQDDADQAAAYMQRLGAQYADWLAGMDAVLTPVITIPAPRLGTLFDPDIPFDQMFARVAGMTSYTPVQNALGLPAMSVPLSTSAGGLPIGRHFIAAAGREDLLLALAYELEQAKPWQQAWPPLSAAHL